MPFRSKAQQRFMYARHPAIAKRWEDKYGIPGDLPEHVGQKKKRLGALAERHRRSLAGR